MATNRTAAEIVSRVRDLRQMKDAGTYRDGFAGDPSTDSSLISILGFVNMAYRLMCRTSFAQELFTISVTTAGEADIPEKMGDIAVAYWGADTNELVQVSREEAFRRVERSASSGGGTPSVYYVHGRRIGVRRKPTNTGSLYCRATTVPDDLAATTDVPSSLPPRYHEALAIFATILLCISDSDDGTALAQADRLASLLESEDAALAREIGVRQVIAGGK